MFGRLKVVAGLALAVMSTAASAPPAGAQEVGLSPTLAAIKRSNTVRLGYREASPPFSFLDQSNKPIGYSLELCQAVVEQIGTAIDAPSLRIDYVKVTSENRIPAVAERKIDFECGSTTNNAERRQQVAFSPLMFVAGTKLMVAKSAKVDGIADLKGKTIVVTRGTTNEVAIQAADRKQKLGLTLVTAEDHEQSYQRLVDGTADAFATDDILLSGLIARHRAQDRFKVVGDLLSYDPYGIMFAKDEPALVAVVQNTFRRLAETNDLVPLYEKWFLRRLPTGERLGVPISAQLEEAFRFLNDSAGARR